MNWPIHRARIDDEFVEKKNDDRWNSSTAIPLRSKQKYAEWRFLKMKLVIADEWMIKVNANVKTLYHWDI